ncbi:MAG: hypothetical protein R6U61_08140 [Thermoplasmata archaeon]
MVTIGYENATPMFIESAAEGCCGLVFVILIIVIIIKLLKEESSTVKFGNQKCPHCGNQIKKWSGQCPYCGFKLDSDHDRFDTQNYDQYQYWDQKRDHEYKTKFEEYKYNVKKKIDRNAAYLKNPLKKGKGKCKDCGTELIYREEYHSWYCPNCHSYQ